MIIKGYNIDHVTHHERLLNEFTNEYGFNLNHKGTTDIFKANTKPRNMIGKNKQGGKR